MDYVEYGLAWVLKNRRGHDAGLFCNTEEVKKVEQSLKVSCNIGPDGSEIPLKYGFFNEGIFPTLTWEKPANDNVKEWLLVVEDPDAPFAQPVVHGIYFGIPAEKTTISDDDMHSTESTKSTSMLSGGFWYGKNRRATIWIPPRGMLGHGQHRYIFQVIGLKEPLDQAKLKSLSTPEGGPLKPGQITKEQVYEMITGKVETWGMWKGLWERKA